MSFNAPKCDKDIKKSYRDQAIMVDTTPVLPERINWNMRPRNKSKEIGPEFRFSHRVQLQRVSDGLHNTTRNVFKHNDISTPQFREEMKAFLLTGKTNMNKNQNFN